MSALQEVVNGLSLAIGSTDPYPWCMAEIDQAGADAVGTSYVAALKKAGGGGARRIVDKNLYNYESVGLMSVIVPGARIIDCRRDPLDTCLACFGEALSPDGHPYASSLALLATRYLQYRRSR